MRLISSVARAAVVMLLIAACGDSPQPSDPTDAGAHDAGVPDAGAPDAGLSDAGTQDAGPADSGTPDAGSNDAGTQDAGPQETVLLFDPLGDPPVVPEPNDLYINPGTGLVSLPVRPEDPPAQQEFTRDYLNTLDGFLVPNGLFVQASGQLDGNTVNTGTVLVRRADGAEEAREYFTWLSEDWRRILIFSSADWSRGTQYVVAVLGGSAGVKDVEGRAVVGSQVWQWVRSAMPLVDGAGHSTVPGLPDSDAPVMERLRLRYEPHLNRLAAAGTRREDVAALWTFTTTGRPRVTFSPQRSVLPFPSTWFMSADESRVALPPPPPGSGPLVSQLVSGLNGLDGFSTTGVLISENRPTEGALDTGRVAADSVSAGTGFLRLEGIGPAPSVQACLDCTSSPRPDGTPSSAPQQLQFVPRLPLDEGTRYAAAVTTQLRDTAGRQVTATPIWAVLRLASPLVDAQGRSQLSDLSDAVARSLEPGRLALKPTLDALEAQGLPRSQVALAFAVRTQSILSTLRALSQRTQPTSPLHVLDVSAQLPALGVPHDQLGGLYEVWAPVLNFLQGPGGVFDLEQPQQQQARVMLTVPNAPMPEAGWPVVLFAHDLSGDRTNVLLIANELARAGFAAVAMDAVHHGERSTCVGSNHQGGGDDNACADPRTQRCENNADEAPPESLGRCVARDRASRVDCTQPAGGVAGDVFCAQASLGRCVPSREGDGRSVCEGGTFRTQSGTLLVPAISGWNMLDPVAPFATRDNLRQAAVDLGHLVRVVRSDELTSALGAVKLDRTRLHFVGVGVGAQVGSLFLAVNDDVQRAVLNVPAADPVGLLLTSPALVSRRLAFLATLQSQGVVQGTPEFDTVIQYMRQALDPADPANAARSVKDRVGAPAGREVFIQYIAGDAFMPTPLTEKFIAAANAGDANRCPVFRWDPAGYPDSVRHSFLLFRAGDGAVTDAAQRQVATFLQTGTVTAPLAGQRQGREVSPW